MGCGGSGKGGGCGCPECQGGQNQAGIPTYSQADLARLERMHPITEAGAQSVAISSRRPSITDGFGNGISRGTRHGQKVIKGIGGAGDVDRVGIIRETEIPVVAEVSGGRLHRHTNSSNTYTVGARSGFIGDRGARSYQISNIKQKLKWISKLRSRMGNTSSQLSIQMGREPSRLMPITTTNPLRFQGGNSITQQGVNRPRIIAPYHPSQPSTVVASASPPFVVEDPKRYDTDNAPPPCCCWKICKGPTFEWPDEDSPAVEATTIFVKPSETSWIGAPYMKTVVRSPGWRTEVEVCCESGSAKVGWVQEMCTDCWEMEFFNCDRRKVVVGPGSFGKKSDGQCRVDFEQLNPVTGEYEGDCPWYSPPTDVGPCPSCTWKGLADRPRVTVELPIKPFKQFERHVYPFLYRFTEKTDGFIHLICIDPDDSWYLVGSFYFHYMFSLSYHGDCSTLPLPQDYELDAYEQGNSEFESMDCMPICRDRSDDVPFDCDCSRQSMARHMDGVELLGGPPGRCG